MNQPHSRDKRTGPSSADVRKGRRVNTGGGPVGGAGRPNNSRGTGSGSSRGGGSAASALGLLALFALLPKKLRRILLIAVAVFVVFSFFTGNNSSPASTDISPISTAAPQTYQPSQGGTMGYPGLDSLFGASGASSPSSSSTGASNGGAFDFDSLFSQGGSAEPSAAPSPVPTAQSSVLDTSVSGSARDKRVTPIGGGRDTVTVMVYMCGTDLESKYGMGTSDLTEMTKATISDKVNVIVETGGCKAWKNNVVSSTVNQIYRVHSGGLERLESSFGTASMTDPSNLTAFIDYCEENYPADRNILILWDHGGGSISGYGYDEKTQSQSMSLVKLDRALGDAGCVFDWIGFDACLMGNYETALVCSDYADYLIASEEVEPGTGWYYTDWLTALSKNTSAATPELARQIIDDYMTACRKSAYSSSSSQVTLSLVDLAEFESSVPGALRDFSKSLNTLIDNDEYKLISEARAGARQYAASTRINQVDLSDLALRVGNSEGNALSDAVRGCVKYNGSTISRSYGMSIYFPYETLNTVNSAVSAYSSLGMDDEYTKCIKSFASLGYGAQVSHSASQSSAYGSAGSYGDLLSEIFGTYSGGISSSPSGFLGGGYTNSYGSQSSGYSLSADDIYGLLSAFSGRSMPQGYEWVDTERIAASAETIALSSIDPGRICASNKGGGRVLSLTEDEWSLIRSVELNVFVDDGEGYIDLGYDNTFEFDGTDLLLDYDGTWLTLNGEAVAYYLVSDVQNDDGSWVTTGRIPALLNGTPVNLRVVFDDENPYGAVTGAYPLYADGETDTVAKGDIAIEQGDVIEFLCDYYDYGGNYSASYTLGSSIVVDGELELYNLSINTDLVRVTYRLTDIYGNRYWVEA